MNHISYIQKFAIIGLIIFLTTPVAAQELALPATTKSKEAKAFYEQAVESLYDVEFQKSMDLVEQSLQSDPEFFMGYFLHSFSSDTATRHEYLEKVANYSGKLNKGEKVIKEIAEKRLQDSKYSAENDWNKISEMYPKNIFPKGMLLVIAMNKGKSDEGLDLADQCLEMNENLPFVYNLKGYIYLGKKQFDKAEEAFDQYIQMAPDKANPYDSKGDYFMAVKDYENAAMSFKKAYDMDNSFTISNEKYKEAMWMMKREPIASEVETLMNEVAEAYNAMDIDKFAGYVANAPELCMVTNGMEITSYSDLILMLKESKEEFKDWKVDISKMFTEVADENVVSCSVIYNFSGNSAEGELIEYTGNYTTIWKKINDEWKIVHTIDTFPVLQKED